MGGKIKELLAKLKAKAKEKKAKRKLNISSDKIFKKFQKYRELTNL